MDEKLKDYKERHIRWQNITLTQFGYTNNIILTLTIGFLAFAFDKEFLFTFSFSKDSSFNLKMCFYILTILGLLISIGCGVLTSLSRLYDFRITRNIILTRQRFYDKFKNKPTALNACDFPSPNFKMGFKTLFRVLFGQINFIDKEKLENFSQIQQIKDNFDELRRTANTLGILTWRLLKFQFLFLVIALILYSINLFV